MDDLAFVQSCIRQDPFAWDEFVEKYSRLIYSYIRRVLNSKGITAVGNYSSDICQELFHSLIKDNFKKLKTYRAKNGCSLASWLRQVSVNFTIDYTRRIKPAVSMDQDEEGRGPLKNILAGGAVSALDALIGKEKISGLHECIDRLDNEDKYFLELYLNRGIKPEKLKKHFKVSRSAIDMRKLRLIARLRECFKSKGFVLDS
ncbi:MAG: sigma-70 family RNA polymerase sigma factor [Candidatus Omnitrophica bacterium]|nr:sigma-70 family RNA polymerase sigma factor [Candidatus Omnitrophota bacterium]